MMEGGKKIRTKRSAEVMACLQIRTKSPRVTSDETQKSPNPRPGGLEGSKGLVV